MFPYSYDTGCLIRVYICAFTHACSVSDYVCAEVEVGRVPGFVITKSLIHATN